MNMGQAAVAATLAGIAVAGLIWWITGVVGNVQHVLKNRATDKSAADDASGAEE